MQFSDTTNLTGGIQLCERWCNLGDAGLSGDATLLKQFTASINDGIDMLMPRLLAYTRNTMRWDDLNHTDSPTKKDNIVSGTNRYEIKADDNSLDILNFAGVRLYQDSSTTTYIELSELIGGDKRILDAISPNPDKVGVPTHYYERGNRLFLYPQPNYSATNGLQTFFEREASYFVSTDTTKEFGVPKPFQQLPFMYASLDWLLVNKPKGTTLITRLEARITRSEKALDTMISKRNPARNRIIGATVEAR